MGSKGGGGGGTTTTTQETSPWVGQQPYLTGTMNPSQPQWFSGAGQGGNVTQGTPGVFSNAANLYENYTPQYFNQSTVSPFNSAQTQALGTLSNPNLSQPISDAATAYNTNLLGGAYTGANNPGAAGLSQYANGSMLNNAAPQTQAAIQQAVAQATPGLLDTFTQGNRLNSPWAANAVAQGETSAAAPYVLQAQQLGQANQLNAANSLGNLSNAGVQLQNSGLYTAPTTAGLPYQGAETQLGAGTTQQTQDQAQLNDMVNRWNFQQQLPYNQLGTYEQMVSGNYGGSSTLTQPYFSQGGKSTGSTIGSVLGTAAGAYFAGPAGAALGGYAGGQIGNSLSDRRLKRNLRRIGTHPRLKLPVYAFQYIWGGPERIGVMAQDVLRVKPSAVSRETIGLAVDYGQIWGSA